MGPGGAMTAAQAVEIKELEIDRYAALLQNQYLSRGGHLYYADPHSLDTITTTLAIVQMLADTDPVPTPPPVAGYWLSADRDPWGGGLWP